MDGAMIRNISGMDGARENSCGKLAALGALPRTSAKRTYDLRTGPVCLATDKTQYN